MQQEVSDAAEEEKTKRREALQKHAARRIQQLELSRGWAAWAGQFRERQRAQRLARGSAARLSRPQLVASMVHWRRDWEAAKHAAGKPAT